MVYEVKISPLVAATVRGTRRRGGYLFGPQPLYLDRLPPEVAGDKHLRVKRLKSLPEGATLARPSAAPVDPGEASLKPERVQLTKAKSKSKTKGKAKTKAAADDIATTAAKLDEVLRDPPTE